MTKTPTPASHAVNTAPDHQPAEHLDALMLAMHLRQRARLTATGNIDALSQNAATVLAAQHEHIRHIEAQLAAIGAGGVEPLRKGAGAVQAAVIVTVTQETPLKQNVEFNWAPGALPVGEHNLYLAAQAQQDVPAAQPARECLQHSDLHAAIMNLPCEASASHFLMKAERNAYRQGHKEARHAAAELVAALQAAPPATAGVAVPAEVDLPDVEDMAHSAVQEALSYGVSHDVFHRWMRAVMDKTVQALAVAPAQAVAVPAGEEVLQLRMLVLDAVCALETVPVTVSCGLDPSEYAKASAENIERKLASIPAQEHATQLAGQGQDSVLFEAGKAAGRQEVKDAQSSTEFWSWIRRAYREPETSQYTIHNMEVAYQAGKAAAPIQAQEDARDAKLLAFIETVGHFKAQRLRVGTPAGAIRWDVEYGHYGHEARGKTLAEAVESAIAAARAAQG